MNNEHTMPTTHTTPTVRRTRRTRAATGALVAVALVGVSACGDDDDTIDTVPDSISVTAVPDDTEPMTTEPMSTDSMTTEPMTTEPMTTDSMTTEPMTTDTGGDGESATIIQTLQSDDEQFSTLFTALTETDMLVSLDTGGPYTLLAPTDEAFEQLPEGVLEQLLIEDNRNLLAQILQYHVLPQAVMSGDIEPGEVETLEGQTVEFANGDMLTVNGVEIEMADLEASNGVIHTIGEVLLPPDVDLSALQS